MVANFALFDTKNAKLSYKIACGYNRNVYNLYQHLPNPVKLGYSLKITFCGDYPGISLKGEFQESFPCH